VKAVDSFSPVSASIAKALKDAGYVASARYLGKHTIGLENGLSLMEANAIRAAGLHLISIWETKPTRASYFTREQGLEDARNAVKEAHWLGQPHWTAIYFTVDFDAQEEDMPRIIEYFQGVQHNLGGYKLGVYGGIRTLQAVLNSSVRPAYWWQTIAWSGGQQFVRADLYQAQVNQLIEGFGVDINEIKVENPGWWS
jgi:hypothetical protein